MSYFLDDEEDYYQGSYGGSTIAFLKSTYETAAHEKFTVDSDDETPSNFGGSFHFQKGFGDKQYTKQHNIKLSLKKLFGGRAVDDYDDSTNETSSDSSSDDSSGDDDLFGGAGESDDDIDSDISDVDVEIVAVKVDCAANKYNELKKKFNKKMGGSYGETIHDDKDSGSEDSGEDFDDEEFSKDSDSDYLEFGGKAKKKTKDKAAPKTTKVKAKQTLTLVPLGKKTTKGKKFGGSGNLLSDDSDSEDS